MKKALSFSVACLILLSTCFTGGASEIKKTADFTIRDPFVLVSDGKYYMYGTGAAWNGYGCWVSTDLENWEGPFTVFQKPQGHTGDDCWWAPECHYYKGSYYLFATYHDSVCKHRGVAIFKSSSPLGPFEQITDGFITPHDTDSIDGTLYIDPEGTPWMVYVQEWTSYEDGMGKMAYARLSEDLTHFETEPVTIFKGTDSRVFSERITDGPFVYTLKSGKLIMLWSNFSPEGYAVATAHAWDLQSKWRQDSKPLYTASFSAEGNDGGHGMIFTDLDGRLMLACHSPNKSGEGKHESAVFLELIENGSTLMLKSQYEQKSKAYKIIMDIISDLSDFYGRIRSAFEKLLKR